MHLFIGNGYSPTIYLGKKLNSKLANCVIMVARIFNVYQVRSISEKIDISKFLSFDIGSSSEFSVKLLRDVNLINSTELVTNMIIENIFNSEKYSKLKFDKNLYRKLDYSLTYVRKDYSGNIHHFEVTDQITNKVIHLTKDDNDLYKYTEVSLTDLMAFGKLLSLTEEDAKSIFDKLNPEFFKLKDEVTKLIISLATYLSGKTFR